MLCYNLYANIVCFISLIMRKSCLSKCIHFIQSKAGNMYYSDFHLLVSGFSPFNPTLWRVKETRKNSVSCFVLFFKKSFLCLTKLRAKLMILALGTFNQIQIVIILYLIFFWISAYPLQRFDIMHYIVVKASLYQ